MAGQIGAVPTIIEKRNVNILDLVVLDEAQPNVDAVLTIKGRAVSKLNCNSRLFD